MRKLGFDTYCDYTERYFKKYKASMKPVTQEQKELKNVSKNQKWQLINSI